jgi:hypothetical protein
LLGTEDEQGDGDHHRQLDEDHDKDVSGERMGQHGTCIARRELRRFDLDQVVRNAFNP